MSMVLTRSPLEPIGMNGTSKRRSGRLSGDGGVEDNEPPTKKTKVAAAGQASTTTTVSTKEQDGDAGAAAKRKKKVYEEDVDDFSFTRNRKAKTAKAPTIRHSTAERASPAKAATKPQAAQSAAHAKDPAPKTTGKKTLRRLPTTPELDTAKKPVRRSKRLSNEKQQEQEPQVSPHKPAHAKSHANQERSPSPFRARPVTVEKKRKAAEDGVEEEKIMRIQLPYADTPVIKRNKEMRKASAENGSRRSSSGMRGKRASSLIDEGRGNGELNAISNALPNTPQSTTSSAKTAEIRHRVAVPSRSARSATKTADASAAMLEEDDDKPSTATLFIEGRLLPTNSKETLADEVTLTAALPHSEVPTAEFFKHISAELTEPRRMRCLLGWCGTRALPPKPEAPKDSTPASSLEFQALQAARVIQEELSQDLITKGLLSDWFSRDESAPPQIPLRKKSNPRNVSNAAKADELERELQRLKKELSEWDELVSSAAIQASPSKSDVNTEGQLSPLHADLLDSPQRAILEQLQSATTESSTEPQAIQQRLRNISENLEFTVDQFADSIHSLKTTRDTAERLANRTLDDAATLLEDRERERKLKSRAVDPMDALRGLAKVLNSQQS